MNAMEPTSASPAQPLLFTNDGLPPPQEIGSPSPSETNPAPDRKHRRLSLTGIDANGNFKPVKRRAAKACAACRARKVRCDVMQRFHVTPEGEATCSNCQMDGIKCVLGESKRRKKNFHGDRGTPAPPTTDPGRLAGGDDSNGMGNPADLRHPEDRRWSSSSSSNGFPDEFGSGHQPHSIYQSVGKQLDRGQDLRRLGFQPAAHKDPTYALLTSASIGGDLTKTRLATPPGPPGQRSCLPVMKHVLPSYVKPLPSRMTSVDIDYLFAKGALSLPSVPTRNALLGAFCEWVHPYMPLLELRSTLRMFDDGSGQSGQISLLLFQAIMFAGVAFVDMGHLTAAGYTTRKAARKAFFQKARVLYDFDYETDRVSLVQSLLLMTYWYETPDDQKDTWHWMGVAISIAYTIGMHRNPASSSMDKAKQMLWKRIWWSLFMRDRLVALGMRRPTRIKDEDYDVPALEMADFEIATLPWAAAIVGQDCVIVRDVHAQQELAQMCMAKSKLCHCISQVLAAQYSVLVRNQGMEGHEGTTRSSVMLVPKKLDQTNEVRSCDDALQQWILALPAACRYSADVPAGTAGKTLFVQRSLLHMIYYTTLSALHRPQILPSSKSTSGAPHSLHDFSSTQVHEASREITRISQHLHSASLERYLPTTGVTVLLPAIIIHLLDIKSCQEEQRRAAIDGYSLCMAVLEKLRDTYASADFATHFLEAAIRKVNIDKEMHAHHARLAEERASRHSPPPSLASDDADGAGAVPSDDAPVPNTAHALSPPDSDAPLQPVEAQDLGGLSGGADAAELNMSEFLNLDAVVEQQWDVPPPEEGAHGESGGPVADVKPWLHQEQEREAECAWAPLRGSSLGIVDEELFGAAMNE